eukprot:1945576-Rhodomonas_salina.4
MDEIQKIVFEIADRCARRKVPVTDMLAAFVAKPLSLDTFHTAYAQGGDFKERQGQIQTLSERTVRSQCRHKCVLDLALNRRRWQAVILESPEKFQLDRALSASDVEELVTLAVERLSQANLPAPPLPPLCPFPCVPSLLPPPAVSLKSLALARRLGTDRLELAGG